MEKEDCCVMDDNDNYNDNDNDNDVDIIEVLIEDAGDVGRSDDMGGQGVVTLIEGEKGEKCEKENDKSKLEIKSKRLEILLTINTTTCDEVIFKKHVVDIIDRDTKCCVMSGVIQRYEFDGRPWDPDLVLIFEDGRRFCNHNFGYMFRYFTGDSAPR